MCLRWTVSTNIPNYSEPTGRWRIEISVCNMPAGNCDCDGQWLMVKCVLLYLLQIVVGIFGHILKAVADSTQHNFLENFDVKIILVLEFILKCVSLNFVYSFEGFCTVTIVVL